MGLEELSVGPMYWEPIDMTRQVFWLENSSFAPWGCVACDRIIANPGSATSGKPSLGVKEAFNKHECSKFPRRPPPKRGPSLADE
jgi:hypothetical protein